MISKEICSKVLTIGDSYNPPQGGLSQVIYTYSREVYQNFRCITVTSNGGIIKKAIVMFKALLNTAYILAFEDNIRIVHIHTASGTSFQRASCYLRLSKFMKKKVVLHVHGGGFKEYYTNNPIFVNRILKRADCIVALTDSWNNYFRQEIRLTKVVTIPNIIPHPRIMNLAKEKQQLHLLFLGHIIEKKGVFDLLELIHEHREQWKGKILLHVGGNHEVDRLLSFITRNNLHNMICYEGWVTGEKKIALLNMMDVFILPSYVEGLPISILEAFSYGKPVITTPVGGIPELVNDRNGFLFPPGDRNALYRIIEDILNNPLCLEEKALKAQMAVEQNFPEKVAEKLELIYNDLLES